LQILCTTKYRHSKTSHRTRIPPNIWSARKRKVW